MQSSPSTRDVLWIKTWLLVGVVMVLFQIMLGGITRLTGSGLSITKWDIVTGTLPPLSAEQWEATFDLYKQTPQYQHINEGMSMGEFKFIFFWEYIHRLWARLMGFVFAIPFIIFLLRGSFRHHPGLVKRLGIVVLLAALAAIFGWIMVASGLIERPWVNAYKLTIHLALGTSLFIYLFFTWLSVRSYARTSVTNGLKRTLTLLVVLTIIQLAFGGFISGMKAALAYPTWPTMHGDWIPAILLDGSHWNLNNFLLYDKSGFMPALVQFVHRNLAYIITIIGMVFVLQWHRHQPANWRWVGIALVGIIVVQVTLGILTLINSKGMIPVGYGALHQGVGILFLTFLFYLQAITRQVLPTTTS